ncbi:MAG TPA: AAA family ATPase [Desulfuromonadales bacterium]|nr:AAA family ATPase [Desulfuromonadales bacterium]
MYTKYFGFNEKPFTLTPNPRFIYLSKNHKEAFAHLLYGINNHYGFIELIGEVGTGKTTVLRTLLNQLQEDSYRTALIVNPCLTGVELLKSISQEFGLTVHSEFVNDHLVAINNFLLAETSKGRTVVLVIDESQNLDPVVLEQIRLISNLETENDKLIQIVLAGQPELGALLQRPELRQLNQRIAVRYRLKSMDMHETRAYIRHRMEVAGETGGVSFSRVATRLIYLSTRGIPRMINILCDRALLIAYGDEKRRISAGVVIRAITELLNAPVRKRLSLAIAGLIIVTVMCIPLTLNFRQIISDTKNSHRDKPDAVPAAVNIQKNVQAPKTGTPVTVSTPADQRFSMLKQEILSRGQKSSHLLAFNSIADIYAVRRITILSGDIFTVPKMYALFAAKRNLRVTEYKGTLDDVIRLKLPFLVETKFSDAGGAYCLAVTSAGKDSVTTSPALFGSRALSKNDVYSIASGTFYLVQKEPGESTEKTNPEQKAPSLSSEGSAE